MSCCLPSRRDRYFFLVMSSVNQGAYKEHIMWVGVGLTWLEGGGDSLKEVLFQWAPKDFSR